MRDALEQRFGAPASAKLAWRAKTTTPVEGDTAAALFKLLEALEDSDDVQNVYANFEVSDEVMAQSERLIRSDPPAREDHATPRTRPRPASHRLGRDRGGGQPPEPCRRRRRPFRRPRQTLAERLVALFRQLNEILDRFAPDEAAVEETFVNKNPSSTLKLGVARGVVLLAPAERGIPVSEYSANLVKKSVVGAGHADKAQVADDGAPPAARAALSPARTPPMPWPSPSATPTTRRRHGPGALSR